MPNSFFEKIKNSVCTYGLGPTLRKAYQYAINRAFSPRTTLQMVVIEVTTWCVLRCQGCVRSVMVKDSHWDDRHMSVEDFKKIIDMLPPAEQLIPQGIGEPTMNPHLDAMIKIASQSKKFSRIEINTNGIVKPVQYYGLLFEAGLTALTISVDSLDSKIIERLRPGTDVEKLKNFISAILKEYPTRIGIRITVGKMNIDHLPTLLHELNNLGRLNVWLQPFFDMGCSDGVLSPEQCNRFVKEFPRSFSQFPNLSITMEQFVPSSQICTAPWKSPAITVDGFLKPCCLIMHQEQVHFGNVLETNSFDLLWNADSVKKCRTDFLVKSPLWCRRCPFYYVRE